MCVCVCVYVCERAHVCVCVLFYFIVSILVKFCNFGVSVVFVNLCTCIRFSYSVIHRMKGYFNTVGTGEGEPKVYVLVCVCLCV